MSDIVADLLRLSEDPNADPRSRRRQTMERLVHALLRMTDSQVGPEDAHSRQSLLHLTTIIRDMTTRIAEADATFSAIVREAAMLIRSLERRRTDAARFTVH
ncbi:hypothetical protein HJC06_18545 [Rhizobium sp. NLR9b]|uniref:hypothetical protein n=1 Tax=unclassified Rhizobium TaxID=2613769 RepID=UPI001C82F281|nr:MULTISPECIES: hypothetical protein [unclassified Rhizobium]MBX5223179.1 hypothetical protein [Rhizobium sp. NLR8a]MBX5228386.1 hypothetical protein [Rhizobium sp. NLR9b]MBX5289244.1 hypothetical protein [Rhizobium sp. NLR10b]MBX5301556.1 hypothetical protein [Rhizobium sp. NLR12b]